MENALERAQELYNRDSVSGRDTLALGFEYFLAKMIHRENWGMPDTEKLT